ERVASAIQNTHSSADEMREHSEYALEEALKPPENPDAHRFAEDEVGSFSDRLVLEAASNAQATHARWDLQRRDVYRHQVEIYKKHAIAAACLIFILLGLPLAIRYPQGGVGMVIATSVVIFFLYYVGLIVGERFANRGQVHPWLAMWTPNIILLVPALYMLTRVGHNVGTNRGSRWDEIRYRFGAFLGRVLGHGSNQGPASAGEPVADGGVG
ncbi:MAG: LptF/LptG family permease, partial [Gemmatimonadota bacterium]